MSSSFQKTFEIETSFIASHNLHLALITRWVSKQKKKTLSGRVLTRIYKDVHEFDQTFPGKTRVCWISNHQTRASRQGLRQNSFSSLVFLVYNKAHSQAAAIFLGYLFDSQGSSGFDACLICTDCLFSQGFDLKTQSWSHPLVPAFNTKFPKYS